MKKTGVLDDAGILALFANLESIIELHDNITAAFSEIEADLPSETKLDKVVSVFKCHMEDFSPYQSYCANQANARRRYLEFCQEEGFAKLLSVRDSWDIWKNNLMSCRTANKIPLWQN